MQTLETKKLNLKNAQDRFDERSATLRTQYETELKALRIRQENYAHNVSNSSRQAEFNETALNTERQKRIDQIRNRQFQTRNRGRGRGSSSSPSEPT
jgi:hypothetical protein